LLALNHMLTYIMFFVNPLIRVPQILRIWRIKSAAGIVRANMYADFYNSCIIVGYVFA
jgi:hypothetical protein